MTTARPGQPSGTPATRFLPRALEAESGTGSQRQHDLVTGKLIHVYSRDIAMHLAGAVAIGQAHHKPFTEGILRAQEQAVIRQIGKRAVRIIGVFVGIGHRDTPGTEDLIGQTRPYR